MTKENINKIAAAINKNEIDVLFLDDFKIIFLMLYDISGFNYPAILIHADRMVKGFVFETDIGEVL